MRARHDTAGRGGEGLVGTVLRLKTVSDCLVFCSRCGALGHKTLRMARSFESRP